MSAMNKEDRQETAQVIEAMRAGGEEALNMLLREKAISYGEGLVASRMVLAQMMPNSWPPKPTIGEARG